MLVGRFLPVVLLLVFMAGGAAAQRHLFILSGQSNMVGLRPEESFTPTLEEAFGKGNVVVVKYAMGSQPIRRWYKDWKPLTGNEPAAQPDLYDSLMLRIQGAMLVHEYASVTFIWMQGERDAREAHGEVYARSLMGLYQQLCNDLGRKDMNMVIGRLSDFDMQNERYPHWTKVRAAQVQVGTSGGRFGWVNTDDLNDGFDWGGKPISNDLHMSAAGYVIMGRRFAERAMELISNSHE